MTSGFIHCLISPGWGGLPVIYSQLTTLCARVCVRMFALGLSHRDAPQTRPSLPRLPHPLVAWGGTALVNRKEECLESVRNLHSFQESKGQLSSNGHHLPSLILSYCKRIWAMNKIWWRCCFFCSSSHWSLKASSYDRQFFFLNLVSTRVFTFELM